MKPEAVSLSAKVHRWCVDAASDDPNLSSCIDPTALPRFPHARATTPAFRLQVHELNGFLRKSVRECRGRAGEYPLVPFFGALADLAPGGFGPGTGPFAQLYACSTGKSRSRSSRARARNAEQWSTALAQAAQGGGEDGTDASMDRGDNEIHGALDDTFDDSQLAAMRALGDEEHSSVGVISGRRRGIRGSRMHDVPVVNRENVGVKRRRARRRLRRFVRSLPEVSCGSRAPAPFFCSIVSV